MFVHCFSPFFLSMRARACTRTHTHVAKPRPKLRIEFAHSCGGSCDLHLVLKKLGYLWAQRSTWDHWSQAGGSIDHCRRQRAVITGASGHSPAGCPCSVSFCFRKSLAAWLACRHNPRASCCLPAGSLYVLQHTEGIWCSLSPAFELWSCVITNP